MAVRRLFEADPNPLAGTAKPYAFAEHTGGVPAEEQSLLLGATPTRRTLGQITSSFANLQIAGDRAVKTLTDTIRVSWVADDTLHELRCVAGAVRDLERTDTDAETTLAHYVLARSADGAEACRIGINEADRALVQDAGGDYAALPSAVEVTVHDERWREGMLGQRVQDLRAVETQHSVALHRAAASVAAAGTIPETVGYDGEDVTGALGAWSRYDDPITIPDGEHEVIATGTALYNFDQSRWRAPTDWVYQLGDDGFSTMYAAAEAGPWHVPPATATDEWVRYRQGDGTWAAHRLRGAETVYVQCLDRTFGDADDGTAILALPTFGGRTFNLTAAQILLLVWEWTEGTRDGARTWLQIPTPLIRAVAPSAGTPAWQAGVTARVNFRTDFASYIRMIGTAIATGTDDEMALFLRLENTGEADGTRRLATFNQVRVWSRRNANLHGRLSGYLLR